MGLPFLWAAHQYTNQDQQEKEEGAAVKAAITENRPKVIGADPDFKRSGDEIMCPRCGIHFQSFSPSLAVTCPGCHLRGFQFPDHIPTCEGCGTRGLCAAVDGVHWKFWVPWPPDVTRKFYDQAERSDDHAGTDLSEWLNRKPRTIRYMNQDELASLREEIIEALLPHGATRERAEELTATLPAVGDRHQLGVEVGVDVEAEPLAPIVSSTETRMPYIDNNGDLIIPHHCPPKYRWWDAGQSIAETRAELAKHCEK